MNPSSGLPRRMRRNFAVWPAGIALTAQRQTLGLSAVGSTGRFYQKGRITSTRVLDQVASPYFVLGRQQPSTYTHVRLGLLLPSGLVWLAIWPGTLRGHARRWQYSLE